MELRRRTVIPAACNTDVQNFNENKRNQIKIKNHLLWNYEFYEIESILTGNIVIIKEK